jgi:hypothetical protein
MQTLSRRKLFKSSLVAGLAATTTGCEEYGKPGTMAPYTVRLLCSGMMAFYWEKASGSLRIVIPPPIVGSDTIHLVRFGGIGGGTLAGGDYQLDLPGYNQPSDPYPKPNPQEEIVFGRDGQGNTRPTLKMKAGGTYARISIPNPTNVERIRWIKKKDETKCFFVGDDATKFGINPLAIPAFYILTYEKVTGPAGLYGILGTSARPVVYPQPTRDLVLHLYSERPLASPQMDHIELFNKMFGHADNGQPLNLVHDQTTTDGDLADLDKEIVPNYLSRMDLATLCELCVDRDGKWQRSAACVNVGDPAGCSNGWVFLDS